MSKLVEESLNLITQNPELCCVSTTPSPDLRLSGATVLVRSYFFYNRSDHDPSYWRLSEEEGDGGLIQLHADSPAQQTNVHAFTYVSEYARMYICMYVHIYACMSVCMYVHVHVRTFM